MAEDARWYVVHTYSGYENKVATSIENAVENRKLHDLILEVKIPTETVIEIKNNKKVEVERKLFPSYVLIKMILTDDSWYVVRNIRGVTGFVGSSTKPVPLTEEEISKFRVEVKEIVLGYNEGDSVTVVDGYLEGFVGVVDSIDAEKGLTKVTVSMMGKEIPVELELDQVEPLVE